MSTEITVPEPTAETEPLAVFVKDVSENFRGRAHLFRVSPEVQYEARDAPDTPETTNYIVVSAATIANSYPETYLFPANEDGQILSWMELEGSQRGTLDIDGTLSDAGYTVERGA